MLRLSELLGSEVTDGRNRSVGYVRDVRFIQDGEQVGEFGRALRVQGIVVGPRRLPFRLGIGSANIRGLVVVKALARLLGRRAFFVEWDQLRVTAPGSIEVRGGRTKLRHADE